MGATCQTPDDTSRGEGKARLFAGGEQHSSGQPVFCKELFHALHVQQVELHQRGEMSSECWPGGLMATSRAVGVRGRREGQTLTNDMLPAISSPAISFMRSNATSKEL